MNVEQWLNNNELAIQIWKSKYQYNNESFEEWLNRVSGNDGELKQKILEKKFLFGGRILAGRGTAKDRNVTLSNCYVLDYPQDNIESIYQTCSDLARTYSYGGGVGICIDKLRPKGAVVNNAAKTTTGAVSFMDTFSKVSETIGQQGRRGALMLALDINHPDIEEFIDIKTDLTRVLGANISVKVDNKFMMAVERNEKHICKFYVEDTGEYIEKEYNARELFKKLVQNNYDYAEPGILYWDNFNNFSLLDKFIERGLFEYAGTNPCAEEPLPAGGSCLLGSINLSAYVKNPFTDEAYIDLREFEQDVAIYIKALNRVLDENAELHPLQIQRDVARDWRQIGLGVMGIADMFIMMGIRYGSFESLEVLDQIGHSLAYKSLFHSSLMNIQDGQAKFSVGNGELLAESYFVKIHNDEDNKLYNQILRHGLRNSALLTIAPTGSISTMLGISGGIEPIFAKSYNRRTISLNDEETTYKVYTPIVKELMDRLNIDDEDKLPNYVVTAHDLQPMERVQVQSVMQKHIDASISSTVNLNEDATFEDVYDIYMQAWKHKLKGITIFRNNCKRTAILTTPSKEEEKTSETPLNSSNEYPRGYVLPTNDNTIGLKRKLKGGCGSIHVQAHFDMETGKMMEVFVNKGGGGGCNSNLNALSRMISLALRGGIAIEDIADQLSSTINCPSFASARAKGLPLSQGSSCANAVGKILIEMNKEFQEMFKMVCKQEDEELMQEDNEQEYKDYIKKHGEIEFMKAYHKCPQCFDDIRAEGGCMSCPSCSFSKCE
jgi:ribonucleoside-diphosphate reductase alpha chain